MKDPKTFVIPDVGKGYKKGFVSLLAIFWVLAAIAGIVIAVGLGLARNDWLISASNVSTTTQATGLRIAQIAGLGAAGILALYGLLSIFMKRQWLLMLPCLAAALVFPALLYAPQWVPFAVGGGATVLGIITLKIVDQKEQRRAAPKKK